MNDHPNEAGGGHDGEYMEGNGGHLNVKGKQQWSQSISLLSGFMIFIKKGISMSDDSKIIERIMGRRL